HPQHVGQISPVLKWPMDKVYWVMPVSGLILVWYSVMNIIDNYRKRNSH
ncbi:TRAP transporter small permease, partial [Escherichia coli]|nr:TRAP transporter small permease [Escherichia coli]